MITGRKIGVLMGGESAEREVSLRSGAAVLGALIKMGYDAVAVDAGRDLSRVLESEGIELAFLVLHGGVGENGSVQGLLEVMGIPYTGSGVLASALAMDKEMSKKVFSYHGIKSPDYRVLERGGMCGLKGLELPVVVKPQAEGSSVGVGIARSEDALEKAVKEAFSFGGSVILERYIEGREVQIGIVGGSAIGGVEVRPSLEFYSYEAKYTKGLTDYVIPPELQQKTYEETKEAGLSAHTALGCRGATRVDLIVDGRGRPFVLEVNTIPGMTETSLLPKIAAYAGMDFQALVEEILKEALEHEKQKKER